MHVSQIVPRWDAGERLRLIVPEGGLDERLRLCGSERIRNSPTLPSLMALEKRKFVSKKNSACPPSRFLLKSPCGSVFTLIDSKRQA